MATLDRQDGPPLCPNCRTTNRGDVTMRGPVLSPVPDETGRFFVCDRCNFTMRERRRTLRRDLGISPA